MKQLISIFFIFLIFISCENELDINAEWEDIPVIYSILDSGSYHDKDEDGNLIFNDEHYVRIQKSFLGNLAAYEMAQQGDSIYYNIENSVSDIDGDGIYEDIDNDGIYNSEDNDIDGDGILNDDDDDADGDGVLNEDDINPYGNLDCLSNCNDDDSDIDGDGILNDDDDDADGDGVSNNIDWVNNFGLSDIYVWIEKLENDIVVESIPLELIMDFPKEEGYFSNEDHQIYKFNTILTDQNTERTPSYSFRINFLNTLTGKEVTSTTNIVQPIRLRKYPTGNSTYNGVLKFVESNDPLRNIEIYPSKNAKMYKFLFRFNYVEVNTELNTRDTLFVDWNFSPKTATTTQFNGESSVNIEFSINVNDFYKYLASSIEIKPNVYRYPLGVYFQGNDGNVGYTGIAFSCADFYFEGLSLDLYNYIISSSDPGLIENRPLFNNISNGVGHFSSKSSYNALNIKFDNNSNDSLSFGRFTENLNFLYFRELGQGISAYDLNGNLINYTE